MVVHGLILLVGLAIAAVGMQDEIRDRDLVARGSLADARVVEIHSQRRSDDITYEFKAGNDVVRTRRGAATSVVKEAEQTGKVRVLYLPDDPRRNRPAERGAAWFDNLAGFAFAFLLVVVPLWLLQRDLRWRRQVLSGELVPKDKECDLFRIVEDDRP